MYTNISVGGIDIPHIVLWLKDSTGVNDHSRRRTISKLIKNLSGYYKLFVSLKRNSPSLKIVVL